MLHSQSVLGTNLIVNGNAESGPAGTATTLAANIPGWTTTGDANVLPYGLTGLVLLTDPAPPDHGFQYFVAGGPHGTNAVLTQSIDVSSAASTINGGSVKYVASAYLGSGVVPDSSEAPAQVAVAFRNASGQTLSTATLGPLTSPVLGMSLQQQQGLVPAGNRNRHHNRNPELV